MDPNTRDELEWDIKQRGELLLQEIFGPEPKPRSPYRRATSPNDSPLYTELKGLLDACRPTANDYRPLGPNPTTNRCLSRLVAILRGHHDGAPQSALTQEQRHKAQQVEQWLLMRIRNEPDLRARAQLIRRAAGLAEGEMERHYCALLTDRLSEMSSPLRAGASPIARLRLALTGFPYLDSYEHLTRSEIALLQQSVQPVLAPAALRPSLSNATQQALAQLASHLRQRLENLQGATQLHISNLGTATVAIVGCGPLPITGLMLHTLTGARIKLVDIDPHAVLLARTLVQHLERLQVLEPQAVTVLEGDAAELTFLPGRTQPDDATTTVRSDAVLVASLVPEPAKQQLAERLRNAPQAAHLALLIRSAAGLCAELAYEPVQTLHIHDLQLPFCGLLVPQNQVFEDPTSHGPLTTASDVLQVAPSDVLNCTELYYRLPLPLHNRTLRFDNVGLHNDVEYAIHLLQ